MTEMTHKRLWRAIDRLAARNHLSSAQLARQAGLSATTLNHSKRVSLDGQAHWPSTHSLAKLLRHVGMGLSEFGALLEDRDGPALLPKPVLPFRSLAEIKDFDDLESALHRCSSDYVPLPETGDRSCFVLETPILIPGSAAGKTQKLLISPDAAIMPASWILVHTHDRGVLAGQLRRRTLHWLTLHQAVNGVLRKELAIAERHCYWSARIIAVLLS